MVILVGGHPQCGPHCFRFTPSFHFCTCGPTGSRSALHTFQQPDPIFKSYRIRFSQYDYKGDPHSSQQPIPVVIAGPSSRIPEPIHTAALLRIADSDNESIINSQLHARRKLCNMQHVICTRMVQTSRHDGIFAQASAVPALAGAWMPTRQLLAHCGHAMVACRAAAVLPPEALDAVVRHRLYRQLPAFHDM